MRRFTLIMLILIVVAGYATAITLYHHTLINRTMPIVVAAAIAIVTEPLLRRMWLWMFETSRRWVAVTANAVAVIGIAMGLFYGINFWGADSSSGRRVKAVIESRYTESRQEMHRVGRRRVPTGRTYKVYYLRFSLPGYSEKERVMEVNANKYTRSHPGDTIPMELEHGAFGFDVVKW